MLYYLLNNLSNNQVIQISNYFNKNMLNKCYNLINYINFKNNLTDKEIQKIIEIKNN